MRALAMPASLAWRALGGPARGVARLDAAPQIPGYRLLREIGTGRRTSAWLAIDRARYAEVVLKLRPAAAGSFAREHALAGRAAGARVVRVHAHGSTPAWSWLAMEHVPGGDLARLVGAPLPPAQALEFVAQAAEALAGLHRQGLVHRDVKPANFLLRADGSLALADFGLVAPAGERPAAGAGTLTGTPRYVAPEQLEGAVATPAADVYSLGVLLHELLCGRPPFAGATLLEVLAQHLVAPPPRLPQALAALQPLVDGMLAKQVHDRLPDAEAVLGRMARGGT